MRQEKPRDADKRDQDNTDDSRDQSRRTLLLVLLLLIILMNRSCRSPTRADLGFLGLGR